MYRKLNFPNNDGKIKAMIQNMAQTSSKIKEFMHTWIFDCSLILTKAPLKVKQTSKENSDNPGHWKAKSRAATNSEDSRES